MFYYRITTTTTTAKQGVNTTKRATEYREFLRPADFAAHVTTLATNRPRAITIQPVNQQTFIRATRKGD